ncbi:hypothetical protein [Streptomyces sp. NPDC060065]|uniref:hypothetical protein n=1 Tax=Streptomyces sp. NPDC060065 TaxID=3347050 RepID=UPI00368BBC15
MSRGEEMDEPITGGEHAVSAESVDLDKPESAGGTSEPAPRFAVVISGDGSAAIDGEPVPAAEGVTVDAAILDTLHGYARERNITVRATISDPSAGYVAFVEVAPDGSSSLLEQQEQPPEPAEAAPGPVLPPLGHVEQPPGPAEQPPAQAEDALGQAEHALPAEPYGPVAGAGSSAADDDLDHYVAEDLDDDDDDDDEAYALGQQRQPAGPPPSPPAPRPSPNIVRRAGSRQSDDEYESPGLLHKPLVVGPAALVVAALVIVPLVILGSGGSDDGGRQKQAARSSDETSTSPQAEESGPISSPSVSALPTRPSATPTTTPKGKPKDTKGAKGAKDPKSGGGVTVTVTAKPPRATVTAKPPQDTAATAVKRLARNDPSGRHICYRAYVTGQGWQKPVCDGTMAGTTGQNRSIKALNIAVSGGTGGSAANAFVHDPKSTSGQGKWKPDWTDVMADGKNNYVGSTAKNAPYMTGFAINIGSGQICQTAKVHGYNWGGQGCTDPRPDLTFGGTLENTRYLEAVKLTV